MEHDNFRDDVLGKDADIVTLAAGMATVVIAEAVIQSALTGKTVDLIGSVLMPTAGQVACGHLAGEQVSDP